MKKFSDYNQSNLSFEQLKNDLYYEFGFETRGDTIFSDEGFNYWHEQLKIYDIEDNLIYLYQDFTNQIFNILFSIYPKNLHIEIEKLICFDSSFTRIKGQIFNATNTNEFIVQDYNQSLKNIILSFYIQSKLLLLSLEFFQTQICKNIALKEVYELLNYIISKIKFESRTVSFNDRVNFEVDNTEYPTQKMKRFVLNYFLSMREEIYHESIVKIHSSSLSKTVTGKNDYSIDDIEGASKIKPTHFIYTKDHYFKKDILTKYVSDHNYFISNNNKGLITKNPKGFNIACAILCRQMIAKGWIKENIGARELMKFLKDEFNIIARAHHPFASSETLLKEQYASIWNLFNNMPTPD